MGTRTREEKETLALYGAKDFRSINKDMIMTFTSTLQNMRSDVGKAIAEHIPEYFGFCSDALARIDFAYKITVDGIEKGAQSQIDALNNTKSLYEKEFNAAKTDAEKEKYRSWMNEEDKKIQAARDKAEEARTRCFRSHAKCILTLSGLAAVGIGGAIKFGKRF